MLKVFRIQDFWDQVGDFLEVPVELPTVVVAVIVLFAL